MQWPWVSRRAYDLLNDQLLRIIKERDEYREEAARAKDALIDRVGFAPVSSPVRAEMKQAAEELRAYEESLQLEDTTSGMISAEVLQLVDDIAPIKDKPV